MLASWAVPRGIPTTRKQNRLAVQTEDHPLEYANFAGDHQSRANTAAADVTIWDSGHYSLEKWRDDEVISSTLDGGPGGSRSVRTDPDETRCRPGFGAKGNQWLMRRTKDQPDLEEVVPRAGGKFGADRKIQHRPPPTDLLPDAGDPRHAGRHSR